MQEGQETFPRGFARPQILPCPGCEYEEERNKQERHDPKHESNSTKVTANGILHLCLTHPCQEVGIAQ